MLIVERSGLWVQGRMRWQGVARTTLTLMSNTPNALDSD